MQESQSGGPFKDLGPPEDGVLPPEPTSRPARSRRSVPGERLEDVHEVFGGLAARQADQGVFQSDPAIILGVIPALAWLVQMGTNPWHADLPLVRPIRTVL